MDQFAHLPAEERAIVFRETAAHLGLGAASVVEKDFCLRNGRSNQPLNIGTLASQGFKASGNTTTPVKARECAKKCAEN